MKLARITAILISLVVCNLTPALAATTSAAPVAAHSADKTAIAWRKDNDLDAAFALAKASHKPLFLYWGAVWCPPCNQVKATIFNRQDFIDKSQHFVPVYLDGDTPGAQKLAARFKVRGYPTMLLLKDDSTEITRLPGEVDAERYVQVLTSAINASLSVQDTLTLALAGSDQLTAEDWSLLADYSWDDPEQKLVSADAIAETLLRLSTLAKPVPSANRLFFKAIATIATAKPGTKLPVIEQAKVTEQLTALLSEKALARDNLDLVSGVAPEILGLLKQMSAGNQAEQHKKLVQAWSNALDFLVADASLSKTDRIGAVAAQIAIAKLNGANVPLTLQKEVQSRVSQIEQLTTDPYERQSVVNAAAHTLSDAGLVDASDNLLKAELKRSHSPYYFMSSLGSNAKARGDKVAAVNWYEQAYNASKGPATRLQWGSSYINNLLDLSPQDDQRIQKAVSSVLSELATTENAFYERNRSALEKMGKKLLSWNKEGAHEAVLTKVKSQLDGICGKLPAQDAQRPVCQSILAKS